MILFIVTLKTLFLFFNIIWPNKSKLTMAVKTETKSNLMYLNRNSSKWLFYMYVLKHKKTFHFSWSLPHSCGSTLLNFLILLSSSNITSNGRSKKPPFSNLLSFSHGWMLWNKALGSCFQFSSYLTFKMWSYFL